MHKNDRLSLLSARFEYRNSIDLLQSKAFRKASFYTILVLRSSDFFGFFEVDL